MIKLTGIYAYPIKSCAVMSLEVGQLDHYGLVSDRRWLVVDESGMFQTQRELPKMSLIQPKPSDSGLTLNAPGMESVAVPKPSDARIANVTVWRNQCEADDAGDEVAQWLSDYLKISVRLVAMGKAFQRPVNPDHALNNDEVSFADGYPFLIISEASLEDLNSRLETPLPMNRFRPNFVVSGTEAFAESDWKTFKIGENIFHNVKPCARCVVTTVDQSTGEQGKEPLTTLATFRKTDDGRILFGENLIHEQKEGQLRVGDVVEILT